MPSKVYGFFPYTEDQRRSGRTVARPVLDLKVNGSRVVSCRALVDTGAPWCVFDNSVALLAGIDMSGQRSAGTDEQIHFLGSSPWVRFVDVDLQLPPPFQDHAWSARCGFLHDADLPVALAGVLGQEGFFDRCVVTFNMIDNYFVVEQHQTFQDRLGGQGIDPYEAWQIQNYDSEWAPPGT